ncbi:MAG TPA: hypothetical protein VHH11_03505 [Gammaproteobacteria bacterium]|nr:hypothetical protein [Gammaproteobacteria bacterium]
MAFFAWLEASGLAEWVRSSSVGYPTVITLHAIGMAIMVGLCVIVDLRLLGKFDGIPYQSLQRLLPVAWVGFGINSLSGTGLFVAQATMFATDLMFIAKIVLVFLGAATAAILQPELAKAGTWPGGVPPANVRRVAIISIVFWLAAIVTGRLTAYIMIFI